MLLASWLAGLVFGIGLIVSGMANPAKVLAFLDLAGKWDPSLALVMAGALTVGTVAFAVARKRAVTFLGTGMKLPVTRDIDRRLIAGSALFGVGWGIAGFCPGASIPALGLMNSQTAIFVAAVIAGIVIARAARSRAAVAAPALAVAEAGDG